VDKRAPVKLRCGPDNEQKQNKTGSAHLARRLGGDSGT